MCQPSGRPQLLLALPGQSLRLPNRLCVTMLSCWPTYLYDVFAFNSVCLSIRRLRISLAAAHTTEDVDALLVALKECGILPAAGSHSAAAGSFVEQDVVYLAKL